MFVKLRWNESVSHIIDYNIIKSDRDLDRT